LPSLSLWWYDSGMKVKTSVTLSEELLAAIDQEKSIKNRSVLVEEATWQYLRNRRRLEREKREFEKINQNAAALNEDALDVLDFQDPS
jgi:metal-responsive CopG/Arc/MetJ family transcriptional regulator